MKARFTLTLAALSVAALGSATDTPKDTSPSTVVSGTVGLTLVNGVTDTQTYNFLVSADRSNKGVDNAHLDAGYFFSRQMPAGGTGYDVTSNFAFVNGRYDRNVSDKLSAYASLGYREDNPNNLSLRSVYGTGFSYDVHDGKVWKWNLSAGGAYLIEKYTNGTSEKQTPSAAFGSQYNRNIGDKITVAHTLNYIPAASNFSDYLLTSVFSLSYQLSKPLKLTINNVVDFQSEPTAGSLKKNSQWFIGLSFGGKA